MTDGGERLLLFGASGAIGGAILAPRWLAAGM